MRGTLRAKITFALLITGLTSAVLVGLIARAIVMQQFNTLVHENSFRLFTADVEAYVQEFGSWQEGHRTIPFGRWSQERRGARGRGAGPGRGGQDAGGLLPPPPGGRRGAPGGGQNLPPFLFVITDPEGNTLEGPWQGRAVTPEEVKEKGRPIRAGGRVVAIAVPIDDPNLTTFDRSYLDAMQNAVGYGVAGAAALALALGFFFSGRLSASLQTLTHAIQEMGQGKLRQHVVVRAKDEIGFLAEAFNRMSADLSQAHHDLQQSNETIRAQAERLQELSVRDEMTGLHNRRYFNAHAAVAFAQAERYSRPFTVAIGDVDHFKKINDTFSHAVGDEVLRQVAQILAGSTRESDIVARFGGEEFVIAFAETPLPEAVATCERIRAAIEGYAWGEAHPGLAVTITLGVDGHVGRGSVEAMLAAADRRLYDGKKSGRNKVCGETEEARA
jgi:two-component system, cell cycle response regulator